MLGIALDCGRRTRSQREMAAGHARLVRHACNPVSTKLSRWCGSRRSAARPRQAESAWDYMTIRIDDNGWEAHNIWQHSAEVLELYRRRARDEAEEMTCAAQAAELVAEL